MDGARLRAGKREQAAAERLSTVRVLCACCSSDWQCGVCGGSSKGWIGCRPACTRSEDNTARFCGARPYASVGHACVASA